MIRLLQKGFIILVIIISCCSETYAQCSGGTNGGTIVPGTAWSSAGTNPARGGRYYVFAATAGSTYYFSFCTADGGSSTYDTQITILNDATGAYVGAGGYNNDFCGLRSSLAWTCTTAGNYRCLVNKYSCANQNNMGVLVYRKQVPLTCPANLGGGTTTVASLPYSSGAGSTCGASNDLTSANVITCGSTWYFTGEDRVWIFTPATTGAVTITLTAPTASYTGLMLYQGCPLLAQGGICIDNVQSSSGTKSMIACLQAGITYYLILDTWAAPSCINYTNLTISAPVPAGGCVLGTGYVPIASLPYSSTGRTTCGKIDDLTSANSISCGSNLYTTAEDEVFSFTAAASGDITITLTSNSSWVGLTLFDGCPMVSSCNVTAGSCVAYSQDPNGSQSMCYTIVSGHTYYLVVDQFASPTCIPSYNISISAPAASPAGSTCATPSIISSLPFSLNNETTACFGNDYSNATPGSCGSLYESGEDKVYRYVASGPECITITLSQASTNNIGYQIYSGCPGGGGTCIASNGGATSAVLTGSAVLPAAGTYYIIVDTWAAPMNAVYDLSVQSYGSGASNDLPCNAISLPIGVYMNGNNNCSGGANEPAIPTCWLTPNTVNSVWFSAVATSATMKIRTTPGSLRNTQIAAYSGTCGNAMTLLGCNDDAPSCGSTANYMSELSVSGLTVGQTFYIVVDGYYDASGSFSIVVIDGAQTFPPVYGQDCVVPNPVCNSSITVGDPGYQAFGSTCDFPGGGTNCLLSGERGSAFYEIQIQNAGVLAFNIVPLDYPTGAAGGETDYDFALWKMKDGPTNTIVNSCGTISGGAAPIRCNYSYLGVTGLNATTTLTAPAQYAPDFNTAYDAQLNVQPGDIYLLVVSNFENSTSGFNMNFGTSPINYTPNAGYVVWSGGIDNDWFKAPNWGGCAIPTCSIDAIIPPSSANMPAINAAGAACKSLTINPSASLTISSGFTLSICQDYLNNGTLNAAGGSTVLFNNASVNQNMNGNMVTNSAFANVTITKTGGVVNMNQNADMKGTFTVSSATSSFNALGHVQRVGGNFSNYGTYTPGAGGTLEIYGTAAQTYYNLGTINNLTMSHSGPGMTLLTNAVLGINGTLTLTNGKIITNAFETTVNNRASAATTAGNVNSFVQGNLRRYLNTTGSYDFPVGHSVKGYQRLNLNFNYPANPTSIDNLYVNFQPYASLPPGIGGSECGYGYNMVALDNGYWDVSASNNFMTGNYSATAFNSNYTNAGVFWTVMRNPALTGWALVNGTCQTGVPTSVYRTAMNGFSATGHTLFGTAQASSPLPVELVSFDAKPLTKTIFVYWATASEIESDHFEVERSLDGITFSIVGSLKAKGTIAGITNYNIEDKNVQKGIKYYYRLKQVDKSGSFTYSQVKQAELNDDAMLITVQPNPYKDLTFIEYALDEKTTVKLDVLNDLGEVIKTIVNTNQTKGIYNYSFGAVREGFSAGVYTIRLTKNGEVFTKMIIEIQ